MQSFAAFLLTPAVLAFAFGAGAGRLGRFLRAGWWWTASVVALTLGLPLASASGYLREVAAVAPQFPEHADVLKAFQWRAGGFMLLTAALTLWTARRDARLAAVFPVMFFAVFYRGLLPPIFADVDVAQVLLLQLGGATNRGLFMACLFGSAVLLGFGVGRQERSAT